MSQNAFVIRHMEEQELSLAVDWAAEEGWNPGIHDAQCFWKADNQGFLVGVIDNQPVGCISAVRYGSTHGFIGFYIVKPQWRGKGYGIQLWQAAMTQLSNRIVGLDGVVTQQNNYKKSGFQFVYSNIRYSGVIRKDAADAVLKNRTDLEVVSVDQIDLKKLIEYDNALFFTPRPDFISSWLIQPSAKALGILSNDRLVGYGVIRQCRKGYKVGPLFADNWDIAEKLFASLGTHFGEKELFLDVPESNTAAVALAAKYNMGKVFETARMYNGVAPKIELSKVFGVTTFELG